MQKKNVKPAAKRKSPDPAEEPPKTVLIAKPGSNRVRRDTPAQKNLPPVPAAFENKAGRYELIRIEGDQAHYSFTNLQKKTVDSTMPVIMWRKMQERAVAFKETA